MSTQVKTIGGFKGFLILLLFAAIFSGIGCFILYRTYSNQKATKSYVTTVGVVVDYNDRFDIAEEGEYVSPYFDEDYVYAPIVEFVVDGKIYEVHSNKYSRNPPLEGTPMEVSYDPKNPNIAVLDKTMGSVKDYAIGGVLTAIGPAILILAAIGSAKGKKKI